MTFRFSSQAFFVGLMVCPKINIIGEIYVGEILAIIYIMLHFFKIKLNNFEKSFVFFGMLWTVAQILSDIINETELISALKGEIAPFLFVVVTIAFIKYFSRRIHSIPSFLFGVTVGNLIYLFIFPSDYFTFNAWKWGLGSTLITLFTIYYSFFVRKQNILLLLIVFLCFAAISLFHSSRSLGLLPLFSLLLWFWLNGQQSSNFLSHFKNQFGVFKLSILGLALLFFINFAFSLLFSSDIVLQYFSEEDAKKYQTQSSGGYGILIGGRSELLVSLQAIAEKPLLGYGSWAKDETGEYTSLLSYLKYKLGYSDIQEQESEYTEVQLIPAHSIIFGAFLWAGIFGAIFWIFLLNWLIRVFIYFHHQLPLYFYFTGVGLFWGIFFSPFGASSRWSIALFVAVLYIFTMYLSKYRGQPNK